MPWLEVEQGTPDWYEYRRGRLTASRMSRLLLGGIRAQQTLLEELRRERDAGPGGWMAGQDARGPDIDRGHELQDLAIELWCMIQGTAEVVDDSRIAIHDVLPVVASSDGVLADAVFEVKAPRAKNHLPKFARGIPEDHMIQVQTSLWVHRHLGIKRGIYLSFCRDVEPSRQLYIEDIKPDPSVWARIETAVPLFLQRIDGPEITDAAIPRLF